MIQARSQRDGALFYQKNIEAVCSTEAEIRGQSRRTVIHEEATEGCVDEHAERFTALSSTVVSSLGSRAPTAEAEVSK
jgi:hypothetical protein